MPSHNNCGVAYMESNLEKKGLKIIDKKYIKTMFYNYKDKTNELVPLNIYFCNLDKKGWKRQ